MGTRWAAIKHKLEWSVTCIIRYHDLMLTWSISPKDEDANYENTTWCNRDLIPIPPDRRTFHIWSYLGSIRPAYLV